MPTFEKLKDLKRPAFDRGDVHLLKEIRNLLEPYFTMTKQLSISYFQHVKLVLYTYATKIRVCPYIGVARILTTATERQARFSRLLLERRVLDIELL